MVLRVATLDGTPQEAIYALWIAWWLTWWAAAIWSDRSVRRPGTRYQLLYRALAAVGTILLFGVFRGHDRQELMLWHTPGAVAWLMLPFVLLGLAFTWWARLHLGRLWSS